MDDIFSNQAPPTQISQSLDNVEDHLYQLSGASSDADPWLLRHCKFDDYGVRRLFKVHIRNAGGVPTREKIPAHFLVGERVVYDAARHEAGIDRHHDLRTELASPELKVASRFMKRVYPLVPVLSRSGMNLDAVHGLPSLEDLNGIPAHLLAAIYGSALPFASEDSFLYLMTSHEKPPMSKIWFMVYKFICENIHSPRLSLIQASILYIHRHVEDEHSYGVADTASVWSIIGMTVGLAHSLGLNLECRLFGLPHEEKSLRRRLWWALYIEDKWASLLFGRPPYIRSSEWDVSEPDDSDFVTTSERDPRSAADVSISFRHMASLAVIAESIQDGLYSLRASQKLSEDIPASVAAAKPLLQSLSAWRESLPLVGGHHSLRETAAGTQGPFPATIYQGYLTLLVYIWRALLRTTVRSTDPPVVIHVDDLPESANLLRDVDWGLHLLPDLNIEVQESRGVQSGIVKDLYEAALTCGSNVLDFLSGLDSHAFHEFWYSWSRKSFATISNFLTLLLVQAPDFSEAAWIAEHDLNNASESKIGWIFSCYAFFLYFGGAQVGPIFDAYDIRVLLIPGSIGFILSMFFLSLSTDFYQYLLSYGVLGGVSASLLFNPSLAAIGHWFQKRRAFATGLACTAGGLAGIAFPLIILFVSPRLGFAWAIRIIAFACLVCLVVACISLRKRLPNNKQAGASIDLRALADLSFATTTLSVFLIEFAVFIPYTYIVSYALRHGFEIRQAQMLNVFLNIGAVPGRALSGYAADRFGTFNTMCVTAAACTLFILGLWLTADGNQAKTTTFVILFGFWSGAAISLTPVCVSRVCKIEDYGKRNGTAFFAASFGALVGVPISGAIVDGSGGNYMGLIIFAGVLYALALLTFTIARGIAGGWKTCLF
ncbi:MMP37-like protein [Purpureocillium lavendulum]|uniref:MMP37-like protein n=1 Tax=Purpureocillium lavendulum TaxID=1247861 RepID=A0AB34G6D7_9HYPO|nr:MMP37-like protein [Purpureocillium lavendulum]